MTNVQKNLVIAGVIALFMSPMVAFSADGDNAPPKSVTKPKISTEPLLDLGAELQVMPNTDMPMPEATSKKVEPVKKPFAAERPTTQTQPVVTTPSDMPQPVVQAQQFQAESSSQSATWSYTGKEAPRYWSELSNTFGLCKAGKNQSPIDLKETKAVGTTGLSGFDVYYRDVPLKVINSGHAIQVNIPLGSYIKIDNHRFELLHYEFHTPSEHQKNGFNYPMEVQLIHKDGEGNFAVIAVIFQEGKENEYLADMLMHLPKDVGKEKIVNFVTVNPAKLFPANKNFFKYSGSLTTPPCTEGVYWMVFKEPIEASAEQIEQLNDLMGENSRPIQPQNARTLLKSYPDRDMQNQLYEFY